MFRAAVFAGAGVLCFVGPVFAQETDAPPLDLRPSLEIGTVLSSNADRARGGDGADVGLRLAPALELQSNWSRHALRAQLDSDIEYFIDSDELRTSDVAAAGDLRLDIRRHTQADFAVSYDMSGDRFDQDATDQTLAGSAALSHDFGGFALRGALAARAEDPASGSRYTELRSSVRGTFSPAAQLRPFIEAGYAPRYHKDDALDSDGWDLAAGLAFDRSPFIAGEVAARWLQRPYNGDTVDAFGFAGRVDWTPTDFTQFTLGAGLDIDDDAGGPVRRWSAHVGAERAVTDQFALFARADVEAEDRSSGTDFALGSELGLRWSFNRYMGLVLAYENEFSFGGRSSDDFDEHRVSASLRLSR